MLRRLIDIDENFIEVRELGEDLAINVILGAIVVIFLGLDFE